MKKTAKIICYISSIILIIFSLIFIFLEARNLFSGDWLIYENKFNGFIRYFLRLLLSILGVFFGIFTFIALNKKASKLMQFYFYFLTLGLAISLVILSCLSTNYLDILFSVIAIFYSLGVLLYFYKDFNIKEINKGKESK